MMGPCKEEQKFLLTDLEFLGNAREDVRMRNRGRKSLEEICVRLCTPQVALHCSIGSFLFWPLMCSHQTVNMRFICVLEEWDVTLFLSVVQTSPFHRTEFLWLNYTLVDMLLKLCGVDGK